MNRADSQRAFDSDIVKEAYHEVFLYYEAAIYHRFDLPIRRLLLELASFDNFDLTKHSILLFTLCCKLFQLMIPALRILIICIQRAKHTHSLHQ